MLLAALRTILDSNEREWQVHPWFFLPLIEKCLLILKEKKVLVSSSLIRIQRACKSAEKVRSDREPIFMSNRITSKNGI